MFKSHRKSSQPTVSPLAPPPASTSPLQPQQGQGQGQGQLHPQYRPQSQQYPSGSGMGLPRPQPGQESPNDLTRIGTSGTVGSVSSRSEKRRSGFFGLGGKKDKDKDKRGKDEEVHARPASFSVDRPMGQQQHPQQQQQLQHQHRFAPPNPSHTPPPSSHPSYNPQPPGPPDQSHQRIVSSPSLPQSNDFGPYPPPSTFPKSQSMGFAPRQGQYEQDPRQGPSRQGSQGGLPENQYAGPVDPRRDQRDQRASPQRLPQQQPVPRSQSMPFNQLANGATPSPPPPPPVERENMRGSPVRSVGTPAQQGSPAQGSPAREQPAWMKQFDAVVDLIGAQPQKTYVASPPELEMILARTSAGGQPKQGQPGSAANDWDSVWLQLSGISLSMWSMKETRSAAAKGEKVPPTYFNITDSSLELLAPLPPPPHRPKSHPHHFVFSLNTAGSNRLLFSCPSEQDLARWSSGLRLAAWERARLEEIYTGHLIKSGGREPQSSVVKGRMEGWVRVRVMGGTDWKRLWVVLSTPNAPEDKDDEKKNRRRSIFGFADKEKEVVQEPNTGVSMASFYLEPRTSKNKTSVAVLTITNITQAYAVFPERLDVMSQSNLMKVVGRIGGELVTIEGRMRDSGWALVMPETPEAPNNNAASAPSPLANMMKWVTGFHDVFGLYGRPDKYIWDTTNPRSLFFAYPQGPDRTRLFLDIEEAVQADFRLANLPAIRAQFVSIVKKRMENPAEAYRPEEPDMPTPRQEGSYRLPPLSFDGANEGSPHLSQAETGPRSLTPITEKTDIASRTNSQRTAKSSFLFSERREGPPSKQGSQGSSRNVTGGSGDQERLAPISDSTETFGVYGEDTEGGRQEDLPSETPTTMESATAPTDWSRSTGASPTTDTRSSATPQQNDPVSQVTDGDRDLPDLPAATSASRTTIPADASKNSSHVAPPLAAAVTSPKSAEKSSPEQVIAPAPRRGSIDPVMTNGLRNEPAAMYLMNMVDEPATMPSSASTDKQRLAPASGPAPPTQNASPERVRPTIVTTFDNRPPSSNDSLGRKPSGARAPPPKKSSTASTGRNLEAINDASPAQYDPPALAHEGEQQKRRFPSSSTQADLGEDAANFVAYAEEPSPTKETTRSPPVIAAPLRQEEEMRSSFAPSKAAAERRAKAEATAVEQQRAKNLPGAGKRTIPAAQDTWSGSEDEDEPEEEASPEVQKRSTLPTHPSVPDQPVHRAMSQTRALPPVPRINGDDTAARERERERQEYSSFSAASGPGRPRSRSPAHYPSRQLPQSTSAPAGPPASHFHQASQGSQMAPPLQYQQQQAPPHPPAQRQTLWNANFAADHGMDQPKSGKFVELEEPSVQLTKAFAPHGLLQAGMQDKEDRSAKKQEELAREMGSSLINVPSKPPPPQTGLLGAVAAHERDRKNAGGIGATLTDREREKRLAEDRQREIEKLQRQQMEHMSRYGGEVPQGMPQGMSQYGGQYPYGMPPMMGMPQMGYNPYQGGYNPFAQQQAMMAAQMAYQQAMMMSQAGSQAGGGSHSPDRPASPSGSMGGHASPAPFGNYFAPPQMPYGSPWGMPWAGSPAPPGSGMGSPWLHPGMNAGGGGGGSDGGERSRVQSMYSDGGGGSASHSNQNHPAT